MEVIRDSEKGKGILRFTMLGGSVRGSTERAAAAAMTAGKIWKKMTITTAPMAQAMMVYR